MNRSALQDIDGILLLDKPSGWGSTDALNRARRLLGARKAGHGGTLDPMATGLLPLAFGQATRFAHESLDASKVYVATLCLGLTTNTGDREGEVVQRAPVRLDVADLPGVFAGFLGEIDQLPPMFSALKRDGRPLYEYARKGETLEREPRRVRIDAIDLLAVRSAGDLPAGEPGSVEVQIRVACGKGTYIRTLAEDIGARLGCGAHLSGLRREAVGALRIEDAVDLARLEAMSPAERLACLRPSDLLIAGLPRLVLDDEHARRFLHGQRLRLVAPAEACAQTAVGRVRVYIGKDLIGTGIYQDGLLAPQRLIATGG